MAAKGGESAVTFREVMVNGGGGCTNKVFDKLKDSQLWSTGHVRHSDLGRLHLRALEAILSPSISSVDIMSAVAYGVTSQGLRVTQREDAAGRIVAQRIEAPYLASFSSGRSLRPGSVKEEWRVVVATLGVSRGVAAWGGIERLLLLEFMTDPSPPPKEDLVSRSSAAMASFSERLGTGLSLATAGMGYGPGSASSAASVTGGTSKNTSAVAIARQRSNQRAEALVEGVAIELSRLGYAALKAVPKAGSVYDTTLTTTARATHGAGMYGDDVNCKVAIAVPVEVGKVLTVELVPLGDKNDISNASSSSEIASSASGFQHTEASSSAVAAVEVCVCLQFVEGLCARAIESSRRDALETWRPLEDTVRRLERENAHLRQLLEPKYRAVGASPPSVPKWASRREFGGAAAIGQTLDDSKRLSLGDGVGGERVTSLLRSSPLFAVDGAWVKARVVADAGGMEFSKTLEKAEMTAPTANAAVAGGQAETSSSPVNTSAGNGSIPPNTHLNDVTAATDPLLATIALRQRYERAVVKTLADVVGGVCEAREEEFLKGRMLGAQAYVGELEAYRSAIVGGNALRAVASFPNGDEEVGTGGQANDNRGSPEIDDDLWRLFGAMETRLYSSPAALGKKPGRIYLTANTLWFHSKVMAFESRHVLPLSEVESVTLLGTALDLSSSLVIATKGGGEVMLVFPGQRTAALEPVELLIRELTVLAAKQNTAT